MIYLRVDGANARLTTATNQPTNSVPMLMLGLSQVLDIKLLDATGKPMTAEFVSGLSWFLVADVDFAKTTPVKIEAETVEVIGGIIKVGIHPSSQELFDDLGGKKSALYVAELVGKDAEGAEKMVIQFPLGIKNRIGFPEVVE